MKKFFVIHSSNLFLSLFIVAGMMSPMKGLSQKTISANVFDATNNKPLVSASINADKNDNGITTGNEGTFKLHISDTVKTLAVSHIGYKILKLKIDSAINRYLIGLQPSPGRTELATTGIE